MDNTSYCYSEISDGLMSNDTMELARRRRLNNEPQAAVVLGQQSSEQRMDRPSRFQGPLPDIGGFPPCSVSLASTACSSSTATYSSSHNKPTTRRRRVRFAGPVGAVATKVINEGGHEYITAEERQIRWWSQRELDTIKKEAKETSLKLRQLAHKRTCYAETAFEKTTHMLTKNFAALVQMSPSRPDQDLRHWCVRNDGRRGLERFACQHYGQLRKQDIQATRTAVFQEQDRLLQLRRQATTAAVVVVPYDPVVPRQEAVSLAKAAKVMSRRARTFSLFMGEADAQAAAVAARSHCVSGEDDPMDIDSAVS